MKCLPCEIDIDGYFDDTVVDDRHLPCDVMDIVEEYDKITYLMLTKNTDGDKTKNTKVDGFYELIGNNGVKYYVDNGHYNNSNSVTSVSKDDNCYIKVRLLYDDGG